MPALLQSAVAATCCLIRSHGTREGKSYGRNRSMLQWFKLVA
jgi:hypothetical protein